MTPWLISLQTFSAAGNRAVYFAHYERAPVTAEYHSGRSYVSAEIDEGFDHAAGPDSVGQRLFQRPHWRHGDGRILFCRSIRKRSERQR